MKLLLVSVPFHGPMQLMALFNSDAYRYLCARRCVRVLDPARRIQP